MTPTAMDYRRAISALYESRWALMRQRDALTDQCDDLADQLRLLMRQLTAAEAAERAPHLDHHRAPRHAHPLRRQ